MNSGIILAAGRSTRYGSPKQLADVDGKPLLQHVLDLAGASALDEIVLVLGHEHTLIENSVLIPDRARVVINEFYKSGIASSLRAGLTACGPDSELAVILLGDVPHLPTAAIERILTRAAASGEPIVRTSWLGTPGHPVAIARHVWHELDELEGDAGVRALGKAPFATVEMGMPPPPDVDCEFDLETLECGR